MELHVLRHPIKKVEASNQSWDYGKPRGPDLPRPPIKRLKFPDRRTTWSRSTRHPYKRLKLLLMFWQHSGSNFVENCNPIDTALRVHSRNWSHLIFETISPPDFATFSRPKYCTIFVGLYIRYFKIFCCHFCYIWFENFCWLRVQSQTSIWNFFECSFVLERQNILLIENSLTNRFANFCFWKAAQESLLD